MKQTIYCIATIEWFDGAILHSCGVNAQAIARYKSVYFLQIANTQYLEHHAKRMSGMRVGKKCAASCLNYENHKNGFYDVFIGMTALDSRQN